MTFKPLALSALVLALPAIGLAEIATGDKIGTTEPEIRAALEAEGHRLTEIEFESGKIEVETYRDGKETEFTLAREDGMVLKIEIEGRAYKDD